MSALVERVLKLYALAAGTTFAHEADAARRMAETLIAKHNITLPADNDRAAFGFIDYWPHFRRMKWELILAEAVAKLCGCYAFRWSVDGELRDDHPFRLAGTVRDLEVCQYLLAILHEQRMRDWLRAKRDGSADSFHSFCFSFARGVDQTVGRRVTPEAFGQTERAFLWYKENYGLNKSAERVSLAGRGRSEAGRAAGEAASLHRGTVGQGAPVRRIGGPT